jgi:hypothetical protein
VSGQEWPTDEEKAEMSGYWVSNDREIIARQVAAREKAAAEKALRDAADAYEHDNFTGAIDDFAAKHYEIGGEYVPTLWLRDRADVLAGEGER